MPERFRESHQKAMNQLASTGKSKMIGKTVEMFGLRKDGSEFPVELSLATWRIKEDIFFTGILRDITDRKKMNEELRRSRGELEIRVQERTAELILANEQLKQEMEERKKAEGALRESETKYRIVADNTYDWESWVNPEGHFIYVSPSCKRITGYELEDFLKDPDLFLRITHPDDRSVFIHHQEEVNQKLEGGEVEFRIIRPDGSYRWIGHVCQPVFDTRRNFLGHRGSNRDITERKIAEEGLRESEKRLRLLSSQLLTVQENERKRIAMELHDGIGQLLTAIKFKVENVLQEKGKARANEKSLEAIIPMVKESVEEIRRIQMDLRPSVLDDLGILATIGWFTREFQKVYSHISIEKEIHLLEDQVPDPLKIVLFRVIQEAMNNIAKHSKADLVHLSLQKTDGTIELAIQDNGQGFNLMEVLSVEGSKRGLGLTSMGERTELSGGSFVVESTRGRGTVIRALWPKG
jgi:PAS domain S-box-containing protein